MNIASLILGQNGIWGDLLSISEEGIDRFAHLLGLYKQVRDDVTAAAPVRNGRVGAGVEVHEKVSLESGRGVVVIFTTTPADSVYITERVVGERYTATDGLSVSRTGDGRARIQIKPGFPGAGIVFFGTSTLGLRTGAPA